MQRNSLFLCLLLLAGCGRKPRSIIPTKPGAHVEQKIQGYKLPTVRGLKLEKSPEGNRLSWFKVDQEFSSLPSETPILGYRLYRFPCVGFVSGKPLAELNTDTLCYLDSKRRKSKLYNRCYLVRPVFMHQGKMVEGKASQIVQE